MTDLHNVPFAFTTTSDAATQPLRISRLFEEQQIAGLQHLKSLETLPAATATASYFEVSPEKKRESNEQLRKDNIPGHRRSGSHRANSAAVALRPRRRARRHRHSFSEVHLAERQRALGAITHQASRSNVALIFGATVCLAACTAWAVRRVYSVETALNGHGTQLAFIFTLAFVALVWQMITCNLERPWKVTRAQAKELRELNVVVHVPAYNEDASYLHQCLISILQQTRLPSLISVTDDGSEVDYSEVKLAFQAEAAYVGVPVEWVRTPNQGKRHAQGMAIKAHPEADVFVTVDSDTTLDPRAIDEGLKPLADPGIYSVAGMILPRNNRENLLTRIIDMWWTPSQLVDRSSLSAMGSVLVNSGVLAFYRGSLMRDNLDGYLNETFFGRPVEFSDDSILTLYALQLGKAVQQPTAFAFTAMPENVSHHVRQYVRWMRGAMIRAFWRLKYLPINRYAFWAHFIGWVQWVLATSIFWTLFVIRPAISHQIGWSLYLIPILIAYGQGLRYFTVKRSDQSRWSQLASYMFTPLTALWVFFVLRIIRWYGMITCLKTGWGTRAHVEVSLTE
jgi:hyaluronan synthase